MKNAYSCISCFSPPAILLLVAAAATSSSSSSSSSFTPSVLAFQSQPPTPSPPGSSSSSSAAAAAAASSASIGNKNKNNNNSPKVPHVPTTHRRTPLSEIQSQERRPREVPMPFRWPIVGNIPDFYARGGSDGFSEVHESLYRDYGPVYGLDLVKDTFIVVADPRVYDQVLRKEGIFPIGAAGSVSTFKDYYDENDLDLPMKSLSTGEDWKDWRMATNPDLYVLWDTYLPAIAEACASISKVAGRETTGPNKTLSFKDFVSRSAFDMFSAVLFGSSPQTTNTLKAKREDVEFVTATQTAFDVTGAIMTNPLEKIFESDLYKTFVVNMDKVYATGSDRSRAFAAEALRGKQQREATLDTLDADASEATSGCPVAALQRTVTSSGKKLLLQRQKPIPTSFANPSYIERLVERGVYSVDEIGQLAAPLLMAGVDTTAYVMGWFYLNLASNPDVQSRLADELKTVLNGADVTTPEQLESLPYLTACLRESHRLTPSAPILTKKLAVDIELVSLGFGDGNSNNNNQDRRGDTYLVPAGRSICLNLKGVPMDPKYVEDPHEFRPERFLPDAVAARKGTPSELLDHPYLATPFGRGKRRCLGANVATAELMVLAARLVQDWEIALEDPSQAAGSTTKNWKTIQKLMLVADPYPDMVLTPRRQQQQ